MRKETRWTHFGGKTETPEAPETQPMHEHSPLETGLALRANRVRLLIGFFAIFALAVLIRMVDWQIFRAARSIEASAQTADLSRGRIVDNHGLLLVTDSFNWDIYVSPRDYRNDRTNPDLDKIAATIGVPIETLTTALAPDGFFSLVAKDVTEAQCLAARHAKEVPTWVWCDGRRKRIYPQGALAAHVVGFTDSEQLGQSGAGGELRWLAPHNGQLADRSNARATRTVAGRNEELSAIASRPRSGATPGRCPAIPGRKASGRGADQVRGEGWHHHRDEPAFGSADGCGQFAHLRPKQDR